MQKCLFLTFLLLSVCVAHGQESQSSQEPAKIEVGVQFSSLNIGPQTKFGLFGKARPGMMSFSETFMFDSFGPNFNVQSHFGRSNHFSMDVGGVLEFYPSARVVARFDCGDTMIRFGESTLLAFPEPGRAPSVVTHQLQFSAGVGFRF
jgi:hypothetical protein